MPHQRYKRASDIGSVGGYFRPPVLGDSLGCGGTGDDNISSIGSLFNADAAMVNVASSVALGNGRDNHMDWMWMDGTEVRFTTLPWIERQLVREWRTYEWTMTCDMENQEVVREDGDGDGRKNNREDRTSNSSNVGHFESGIDIINMHPEEDKNSEDDEEIDQFEAGEYERARTLAPRPLPRPEWEHASSCYACQRMFGPTLHRHHCRR